MSGADIFRIQGIDPILLCGERRRVHALICTAVPPAFVMEVGSTAIEGLIGKGDLDFAVCVPRRRFGAVRRRLDAVFARNLEQLSTEEFQGYSVASPLDVAIQLTVSGGPYDDFAAFLALLRASPALCEAYNALKREWDGKPMDNYRAAKVDFIEKALQTRR